MFAGALDGVFDSLKEILYNTSNLAVAYDVRRIFGVGGIEAVLAFIETTGVGKRREVEDTKRSDEWQMAMLDRGEVEGEGVE
jgi:hypothetical protein